MRDVLILALTIVIPILLAIFASYFTIDWRRPLAANERSIRLCRDCGETMPDNLVMVGAVRCVRCQRAHQEKKHRTNGSHP